MYIFIHVLKITASNLVILFCAYISICITPTMHISICPATKSKQTYLWSPQHMTYLKQKQFINNYFGMKYTKNPWTKKIQIWNKRNSSLIWQTIFMFERCLKVTGSYEFSCAFVVHKSNYSRNYCVI